MDEFCFWRITESLTPIEAAALSVGVLPDHVTAEGYIYEASAYYLKKQKASPEASANFSAMLTAIAAALKSGRLKGDQEPIHMGKYDLGAVRIDVDELRAWLVSRKVTSGFFFPDGAALPGYLDKNHIHYPPKLAAAIRAWEAVTSEPALLNGKTPKQAIQKWLLQNAAEHGLLKDDGTQNILAIEEVSKLANWKPAGGASKTPC
jgi:hypothetical protein